MKPAAFVVALSVLVFAACARHTADGGWPPGNHPSGYGRLTPDVIQGAVRARFDRMRGCYESGFRKDPNLHGRITTKFLIDRQGAVAMMTDGGTDLPDKDVVQCVWREFGSLRFPPPDGGEVVVLYPIVFNPGD